MHKIIPGTTLKNSEGAREEAFSLVSPVLEATGGLTLSQLSKLTGLEGTTIQNWIKRGWVSSAKSKRYSEKQVVRILLINMLRGAMKLDDIARLMCFVNGDVEDTADDIISDINLYNMLCRIIFTAEEKGVFGTLQIWGIIEDEISANNEYITDPERLRQASYIMVLAYRSGYLKSEMEKELSAIFQKENKNVNQHQGA